ncbi:MAG TPA: hypothetical protein VFA60_01510 [Terriglobales bacterium]|nr:hypothetical protein [Terriglobales bacterium]
MRIRFAVVLAILCFVAPVAQASGHGPVFGFATPVNSQGETSFDFGIFGRSADSGSQTAAKSMISYGVTPHFQLSLVAPGLIQQGSLPMSMMSGGEYQGNMAWRFHHNANAVGRRFESTASVGFVAPGPQDSFGMFRGIHWAPGINAWAATGVASRSHYVWLGGGLMSFAERGGDRRPDVYSATLVYGYRPPSWRADRHAWDWRVFAELTGEHTGLTRRSGAALPGSDASVIFLGPSVLGIYKFFAVSGGVQFPLFRDAGPLHARERARLVINLSYFHFPRTHSH